MKISVIIPSLNEELMIERALQSVLHQGCELEIIVVDGGSRDRTVSIARKYAMVIHGPRGRAKQMNIGASHSSGDVLVFLHADTQLTPGYAPAVLEALRNPAVVGGCAPLRFDSSHSLLSLYSRLSMAKIWLFHYGDCAIFVRRNVFEMLGGFRDLPILEDIDFLRMMRRHGSAVLLDVPVLTSARRFLKKGIFLSQVLNVLLVISFLIGVPPEHLARWYPDVRE